MLFCANLNYMKFLLPILGLLSALSINAKELTVVSYNIKHGVNMKGQLKLDDTASALSKLMPDVIALQEVDNETTRANKVAQTKYLADKLGMHHVFGKAIDLQGGGYGMAILTKFPILEQKVHRLPSVGEKRVALEVVVEPVKGKKMSFVCIHFDYASEKTRQPQIKTLLEALKSVKHPVVLFGDFNATPESPSIALFKKDWYNVPKEGPSLTYPADEPKSEIDFFMLRGLKTKGLKCTVIGDKNTSDHRPLLLKFKIN